MVIYLNGTPKKYWGIVALVFNYDGKLFYTGLNMAESRGIFGKRFDLLVRT